MTTTETHTVRACEAHRLQDGLGKCKCYIMYESERFITGPAGLSKTLQRAKVLERLATVFKMPQNLVDLGDPPKPKS